MTNSSFGTLLYGEHSLRLAVLLALAALALPWRPAAADSFTPAQRDEIVRIVRDALKTDPSILRDAVMALQADDATHQASATRDAIGAVRDKLVDPQDPVAGNPQASTTIVEFFDTRCPYCRRMLPTFASLLQSDPNLKLVYKDWPILGPASQIESRALLAAQKQGGYLRMHDAIMTGPPLANGDAARALADRLGLDGAQLLRDMDDPAIKTRLDNTMALARQLGLQGTPAIIIGQKLVDGAVELDELKRDVAEARAGK